MCEALKAELLSPCQSWREQAEGGEPVAQSLTAGVAGRARESWSFVRQPDLLSWPPQLLKGRRLQELLSSGMSSVLPGLLNFPSWWLFIVASSVSSCRFMLSSRDLMLRKWILQVGSAPPLALTSPARQPTRLVSKRLGNSKEQVPCPVACHVAFRPISHVSVQTCISHMTKDEEHSMCQNSICVIFNTTVFILIIIPLSGLALRLGLFLCMLMIKSCATLSYSETLVTVGSHFTENLHCCPSRGLAGRPPGSWGFSDTWWYFTLARHTFST